MIASVLGRGHGFKRGLSGLLHIKLVCFRGFSALSNPFLSDSDSSLSDDSIDEKPWSTDCRASSLHVVGNERERFSPMERVISLLSKRGWNINFAMEEISSSSGSGSSVIGLSDSDVARILNDLFGLSSDASLTFYFFQMCKKHVGSNLGIRSVCTMIHILVMGGMNYRAMDLIRSTVGCSNGGEDWVELILHTLHNTCQQKQVLETVYSMLVKCCVEESLITSALQVIHHMMLLKLFPSAGVCIELLQVLLTSRQIDLAWNIVYKMQSHGTYIGSEVIGLFIKEYCAEGSFSSAFKLFNSMEKFGCERDAFIYTMLIDALCKRSYIKHALSLYYKMIQTGVPPDLISITSVIDGCCKLGKWTEAVNLLRLTHCHPDIHVYNCFISKLCRDGNVLEASKLLYQMPDMGLYPDACSFTTMIGGYCKINDLRHALAMLGEMLKRGVKPSLHTYTMLIDCYSKKGDFDGAEYLVNVMKSEGINPDVVTYNVIIDAQSKYGLMHKAYQWVNIMRNSGCCPDVKTYNILIHGLINRGYTMEAKEMWSELLKRGYSPDLYTFTNMIDLNSKRGDFHHAYLIWCCMSEIGVEPDVVTCSALLNSYCKGHQMEEAEDLFYRMLEGGLKPDLVLFNTIINGFCMINHVRDACKYIHMMVECGILPNSVTFRLLIIGLSQSGFANAAEIAVVKIRNILVRNGIRMDDREYAAIFSV